ncbi:MAG: PHP domain-containing protein [Lachnospiraceae bacterium]|nr:PHP domain-containing protein [Lachnospiraceae bacterium]
MKIDMHCHVKEGSLDCAISFEEYITTLKSMGFQGMLITDHNTYRGYRHWKNKIKDEKHTDFVVLKGIEYDTRDAGHIIVIMPEGVKMRILELRGLPVSILIDLVHRNGGVLGPAHPCGEKYLSITKTKRYRKSPEIMHRFDFLEGFNCCESPESNENAMRLAKKYDLLTIGGSDSHRHECLGKAYTVLPELVACETELIGLIHQKVPIVCGGTYYNKTAKERMGKINQVLVYSFWIYNKVGAWAKIKGRKNKIRVENTIDPIDPVEIYYTEKLKRKS